MILDTIVEDARRKGTSDVHIAPEMPIRYRINGKLQNASDQILSASDCEQICREAVGENFSQIETIGELDMAGTYAGDARCRLNFYRTRLGISLALRLLSQKIPELDSLGLPPVVSDFPCYNKGIVLVTGETGSGKSTTLASVINRINQTRPEHIITLEDPIEYIYKPDQSSIDQREIGRDTVSFAEGLRAILREDPDVILVGEMRDLDTIETALTAAETGHLVFGTVHTQSASDSVDRLVGVFPEARQRQIRLQLSMTLAAVLSQQLLPRADGQGRICACEVMIVNSAIRNLIREGKTPQIENTLATSANIGSITMDNALIQMVRAREITRDTAIAAAHDPEFVKKNAR